MRLFLSVFVLVFMTSCSFFKKPESDHFTIKVASNRLLEMEPCGCIIQDMGGIDAEWELLQKWEGPKKGLYLAGGTTFVPKAENFVKEDIDHYRLKGEFIVRAMNQVGVSVVSPSANDLALGETHLQALRKAATFDFVSVNLYSTESKKPIFPQMVVKEVGSLKFAVLGVSGPMDPAYSSLSGVEVRDPAPLVKELLQKHKKDNVLFVLVSSASKETHEALIKQFPDIRLVVGGTAKESFPGVNQAQPGTLLLNPESEGRALTFLELKAPAQFTRYFGPDMVSYVGLRQNEFTRRLETKQARLSAPDTGSAEKAALLEEISALKVSLARDQELVKAPDSKTAVFGWRESAVHRGKNPPKNALTKLIDEYNEAVRKRALEVSRKRK